MNALSSLSLGELCRELDKGAFVVRSNVGEKTATRVRSELARLLQSSGWWHYAIGGDEPESIRGLVDGAGSCVPPELWSIVEMRTAGMTLQEIGDERGVSRERIRQLEKKALQQVPSVVSRLASDYYEGLDELFVAEGIVLSRVAFRLLGCSSISEIRLLNFLAGHGNREVKFRDPFIGRGDSPPVNASIAAVVQALRETVKGAGWDGWQLQPVTAMSHELRPSEIMTLLGERVELLESGRLRFIRKESATGPNNYTRLDKLLREAALPMTFDAVFEAMEFRHKPHLYRYLNRIEAIEASKGRYLHKERFALTRADMDDIISRCIHMVDGEPGVVPLTSLLGSLELRGIDMTHLNVYSLRSILKYDPAFFVPAGLSFRTPSIALVRSFEPEMLSLSENFPEIAAQWHPSKNASLSPSQVRPSEHRSVWWKCGNGHAWEDTVIRRCYQGQRCPRCGSGGDLSAVLDVGTDDLAMLLEEIF